MSSFDLKFNEQKGDTGNPSKGNFKKRTSRSILRLDEPVKSDLFIFPQNISLTANRQNQVVHFFFRNLALS